jgi:hypothetical protein
MKEVELTCMRRSITMNECITQTTQHFTASASLAAIGVKLSQLDFFGPIRTHVQIRQKTVKHTPVDKLTDAFISLLAGAHGVVEITTLLRTDVGLQRAFGRSSCAEQSVVQETDVSLHSRACETIATSAGFDLPIPQPRLSV